MYDFIGFSFVFFRHYHHPVKNRHSCIIHILQIEHLERKRHLRYLLCLIHIIHFYCSDIHNLQLPLFCQK